MTMLSRVLSAALLCSALAGITRADDAVLRVEASEPRAYGYQVGDHVQRHIVVHAPAGWTLDEASLPRPGGRGTALELRSVQRRTSAAGSDQRIELDLDYQVFLAPAAVRTVEIAPIALRFAGASRTEDLRIDAWPVTIAPLVQVEAPTRRGLGELRPDRPPLLRDTSALRTRLLAWAVIALLLIATLAVAYLGPPWRAARHRPFGVAWRQLRRLPAQPGEEAWRAACMQLHEALNRTAGEVLFERDLDAFVQRQPGFAPLREELQRFLHTTRGQFFGGAPRSADDGRWLVALCRRCRDAERGLA
jgi:mxaA protein